MLHRYLHWVHSNLLFLKSRFSGVGFYKYLNKSSDNTKSNLIEIIISCKLEPVLFVNGLVRPVVIVIHRTFQCVGEKNLKNEVHTTKKAVLKLIDLTKMDHGILIQNKPFVKTCGIRQTFELVTNNTIFSASILITYLLNNSCIILTAWSIPYCLMAASFSLMGSITSRMSWGISNFESFTKFRSEW